MLFAGELLIGSGLSESGIYCGIMPHDIYCGRCLCQICDRREQFHTQGNTFIYTHKINLSPNKQASQHAANHRQWHDTPAEQQRAPGGGTVMVPSPARTRPIRSGPSHTQLPRALVRCGAAGAGSHCSHETQRRTAPAEPYAAWTTKWWYAESRPNRSSAAWWSGCAG